MLAGALLALAAAQMEPVRAECSAFRLSEMRLGANAGWYMAERALLRK